jgi:hypothetical protein
MPADVRSIAAVIDWRADLTNYGDLLAEAMAGVDLEIRRAADWLEEQLSLWKKAVRDCEEEVVRAKAELNQRKFPTGTDANRIAPCRRRRCGWRKPGSNTPRRKSKSCAGGWAGFPR